MLPQPDTLRSSAPLRLSDVVARRRPDIVRGSQVPKHRRKRPSRAFSLIWVLSILAVGAFATSFGTSAARAEDEPPPEESIPATETPSPPIFCSPTDRAGEPPSGTQELVGRVSDGVNPVADVQVQLTTSAEDLATTTTNALGEFRFESLGNATYIVSFYDQTATYASGFYAAGGVTVLDKADATGVVLSGSGASGIDVTLTPETFSSISGVVTADDGAPVGDVLVSARGAFFPLVGCDLTNGGGAYQITELRSGVYNVVGQKADFPDAPYGSTVTVPPDAVEVDLQFPPVHTLSGVVLDGDGAPVDDIFVAACETTTNHCGGGLSGGGIGAFDVSGLVAGSYVLRYEGASGGQTYRTGYYGGEGQFVATEAEAEAVAVPGGPVQLLVVPAPTVTGTITAPGAPSDSVLVSLCDADESNCFAAYADDLGAYSIGVAVPGTYVARVFDHSGTYPSGGYLTADESTSPDPGDALEIVVAEANVGPIDATLPEGGRIDGTLSAAGAPVVSVVEFCISEFACPDGVGTDETGSFASIAMFPRTYYVKAHAPDFSAEYWYVEGAVGSTDFADATAVVVTAGATESVTVDIPGAGTHTDDGGPGVVAPVEVILDDGTGTTPVSVTFSDVEASGTTTLTISETGDPLPSGFQLGLPATYYDISTTAEVVFPAVVCITYAGVSYLDEANLRLFHYDDSIPGWDDITVPPVDTDNDRICGETTSLSPFVLAERVQQFSGFFQPVDNSSINRVKAGAGVPVKFSLGGDFGLDVFADGYPSVTQIACPGMSVDAIEQTVSVGSSHLVYDAAADQYVYLFKTSKSWAGTCRELTMVFSDGTTRSAAFDLTR